MRFNNSPDQEETSHGTGNYVALYVPSGTSFPKKTDEAGGPPLVKKMPWWHRLSFEKVKMAAPYATIASFIIAGVNYYINHHVRPIVILEESVKNLQSDGVEMRADIETLDWEVKTVREDVIRLEAATSTRTGDKEAP